MKKTPNPLIHVFMIMALLVIPFTSVTALSQTQVQAKTQEIRFGVYQSDKASTQYKRFMPIIDELNQSSQHKLSISLKIFATYQEGIEGMVTGQVDFMRLGPASYVKAKQQNPALKLIVMELVHGKPRFNGVIIVPAQSPIKSLAQLQGKRFAFGNANSTIGRFLSQALLVKAGITARNLASFDYLGRHDKVAFAVGLGDYDAGACKEKAYLQEKKKGTVRSLAYFDNISQPWVARSGLDEAVFKSLQTSLLTLKDKAVLKQLKISGFARSEDSLYDFVRAGMIQAKAFHQ